jgi:hypothetical protein
VTNTRCRSTVDSMYCINEKIDLSRESEPKEFHLNYSLVGLSLQCLHFLNLDNSSNDNSTSLCNINIRSIRNKTNFVHHFADEFDILGWGMDVRDCFLIICFPSLWKKNIIVFQCVKIKKKMLYLPTPFCNM